MKGTVFAIALNHQSQLDAWEQAFREAPYKTPPRTPVWFIKPRNTVVTSGASIGYPAGEQVQSGGTVALVIGKTARKVSPRQATDCIAGYALANELSLPETSFYRPAIQAKCRDGFCPLGEQVTGVDIRDLTIITEINGRQADAWSTRDLVRDAQQVVSALSEFATLQPGDVILLGTPHQRVTLHPGDQVRIMAAGFPVLENTLIAQGATS